MLALAQIVLAGGAGAVGQPQADVAGADGLGDLDALQTMLHGLAADGGVGVAQAAELVLVILEDVGVDGAQGQAQRLGISLQARRSRPPCPRGCAAPPRGRRR